MYTFFSIAQPPLVDQASSLSRISLRYATLGGKPWPNDHPDTPQPNRTLKETYIHPCLRRYAKSQTQKASDSRSMS